MNELDDLLSKPLAKVEDEGFNQKVMDKIAKFEAFRKKVLVSVVLSLTLLALFTLPITSVIIESIRMLTTFETFASNIQSSPLPDSMKHLGVVLICLFSCLGFTLLVKFDEQ